MLNNERIGIYFPGFTRKSVTFSIDDGNITYDKPFLDILKPAGIKGTFNLCDPTRLTPAEYREFYEGYEIANHCLHHPMCFDEGQPFVVSDDPFDRMESREYTAEDPVVYKTDVEHLYRIHSIPTRPKPDAWFSITDREHYLEFARVSRERLEEVFGKGSVKSFVWPYREQSNACLLEDLIAAGYNSIRKSGGSELANGFEMPKDRMRWTYNARESNLLDLMERYEAYEDDGELKFFSFGVHSRDYVVHNRLDDLAEFAKKYGNRPNDYYYATVSEIFEYEDAVNALEIVNGELVNNSDLSLYITIDGERMILNPRERVEI